MAIFIVLSKKMKRETGIQSPAFAVADISMMAVPLSSKMPYMASTGLPRGTATVTRSILPFITTNTDALSLMG